MFKYNTQIRLHHTDAAGLLFFTNQLVLAHDAFESLFDKIGLNFKKHLINDKFLLPIVHIESDYKKPLHVGDHITIVVRVSHIGNSSFILDYKIKKGTTLVGTVKTVHVTINKETKKKIPIPKHLLLALTRFNKK